jgi:hypothetical protein
MTSEIVCTKCNFTCYKISNWEKHIATKKHNSVTQSFECRACGYSCAIQSLMDKHRKTHRHQIKQEEFERSGLYQVVPQPEPAQTGDSELMAIIKQLLAKNSDLQNFIVEQAAEHKKETIEIVNKVIEQSKTVNNNNNNTIINNKAFNINMYLNEQCKDAMNLSDFINRLEVSREDLENNAQLGFVNGISKIIIDSLKTMSKSERPIHCTDLKRETMYIKDDDKWSKEEDNKKLNHAIQTVTSKSIGTLINWKEENPDYEDMDSEFSSRCIVIQQQSMAGYNRDTYYPKVIHAIARETLVDK